MTIEEKVKEVKKIYRILDAEVLQFKKENCLKCLRFCSYCCEKADIGATVLEFLPLAHHLYNEHLCEEYLAKLKETETLPGYKHTCTLLTFPDKKINAEKINAGRCLTYKWRPLLCRLFGFAAVLDKNSRPELVTCANIKQKYNKNYEKTVQALAKIDTTNAIEKTYKIPIMKNYYMMLYGIDISLGQTYYPLNTALRMAIETVLSAFAYR